jgi:hypothetical protein
MRPLINRGHPSVVEKCKVRDFVAYENTQGRSVCIGLPEELYAKRYCFVDDLFNLAMEERPIPDDMSCCSPFREGCLGDLVCHGTTLESALGIIRSGYIWAKSRLSCDDNLLEYSKRENAGDPIDYSDYVYLANGNCVAPEIVVAARRLGIYQTPEQASASFQPSVRFFFRFEDVCEDKGATFDGIHPVKTRNCLSITNKPSVIVASKKCQSKIRKAQKKSDRLMFTFIDSDVFGDIRSWSDEAYRSAADLMGR